jgi:hypothetical protein
VISRGYRSRLAPEVLETLSHDLFHHQKASVLA